MRILRGLWGTVSLLLAAAACYGTLAAVAGPRAILVLGLNPAAGERRNYFTALR